MPTWFLIALIPPLLFSATNLIDVLLLRKIVGDLEFGPLLLFSGLANAVMALVAFIMLGGNVAVEWHGALWATMAGVGGVMYLVPYFISISRYEPDVISAFFRLTPIFLLAFTWITLGESLSPLGMLAVCMVVLGVIGVTQKNFSAFHHMTLELIVRMLCAVIFIAGAIILFKFASESLSYWESSLFFSLGGMSSILMLFIVFPEYLRETWRVLARNPRTFIGANLLNEVFDQAAWATERYAITLGPVVYVQAVAAAFQPFYMFFGWMLLARVFRLERSTDGPSAQRRLFFFSLIAAGIFLLYSVTAVGSWDN